LNEPPTGISSPTRFELPELTKNLVLGRFTVLDQDGGGGYTWIVSDSRFEIVNGELRLSPGAMLDYELESKIALTVRATDGTDKFTIEKTVTVTVTDQDDQPTGLIISGVSSVKEGEFGVAVGTVSVMDADVGEKYSFGVSDSRFEVVRNTIKLKAGTSVSETASGFLELSIAATSLRTGIRLTGNLRFAVERDMTPHHNDKNPYDVDGDGAITPLDPLIIINHINKNGSGPIIGNGEGEGSIPNIDVDGDGEVTPLDILILINRLNGQNNQPVNNNPDSVERTVDKIPSEDKVEGEGESSLVDASFSSYMPDTFEETRQKSRLK